MMRAEDSRLYPSRFSSRYYILTLLREELEKVARDFLPQARDESLVVDFGCGEQPYRGLFEEKGWRYLGVDLPENELADLHADENGKVSLPDRVAELVLSTQVLEHVSFPYRYLKECHRLLKPGGVLVLTTHGYWRYHPAPRDLWRWTREGLEEMVRQAEFEVVRMKGLMGLGASGLQLFQDWLNDNLPGFVRPVVSLGFQVLMALTDKIGSGGEDNDACVFLIVGKKADGR